MEALKNKGIMLLNMPAEDISEKTVIIVGVPRSGTSMVAKIYSNLGVFIGEQTDLAVFEDVRLANAFENDADRKESPETVIEAYNARHKLWAFKRPAAFKYLSAHLGKFRAPRLIATFRDPVAIAQRNQVSMNQDTVNALCQAEANTRALLSFLLAQKVPSLLLSYEKALADPHSLTVALSEFAGLHSATEALIKAAETVENGPEIYLQATQVRWSKATLGKDRNG